MRLDPALRPAAMLLARLRASSAHSIGYALLGTGIGAITMLPNWLPHMNEFSLRDANPLWWRDVLALLAGAVLVTTALRACMGKAAELGQRPLRFAGLLLLVAAAATFCMWLLVAQLRHARIGGIALAQFAETWWQTLLWSGLLGWLFVLHLQRVEDQEHLDALQLRGALLARELARTRLGAARAQVEPALVARILREVHRRYPMHAESATILLEQLIGYLRLAMQRVQQPQSTRSAEAALVRAFVALHAAERGIAIACSVDIDGGGGAAPQQPLFVVVRALLDAAVPARAQAMRLRCALQDGRLQVALALHGQAIGAAERAQLGAALQRLLPGIPDPLQYVIEPGVHTYVVCLAAR